MLKSDSFRWETYKGLVEERGVRLAWAPSPKKKNFGTKLREIAEIHTEFGKN